MLNPLAVNVSSLNVVAHDKLLVGVASLKINCEFTTQLLNICFTFVSLCALTTAVASLGVHSTEFWCN